jgi:hypothetical protein
MLERTGRDPHGGGRRRGRVAGALVAAFALGGCGPIVVPYPPPQAMPGVIEGAEAGRADLGLGSSIATGVRGSGDDLQGFVLPNYYGGWFVGDLDVGIGHGVDIGLAGTSTFQGPSGGVSVGMVLLNRPAYSFGVVGGVAGCMVDSRASRDVAKLDADGEPVVDDEGEPVEIRESYAYAYTSVAPSVGARFVWRQFDQVHVPILLRTSYSFTLARDGLEDWTMPRSLWFEISTGVVYRPVKAVGLSIGTGYYFSPYALTLMPGVIVNTGIDVSFGVRPRE